MNAHISMRNSGIHYFMLSNAFFSKIFMASLSKKTKKQHKKNTKKTQKKQMVTSPTDKTRVKWMNSSTSLFIDGQK